MSSICRICLNTLETIGSSHSIFDCDENQKKIYTKIMELSGIIILEEKDDNLPNEICNKCYGNLSCSYNFRNLCRNSDEELKKKFYVIKKENENSSDNETNENLIFENLIIKEERSLSIDHNLSPDRKCKNLNENCELIRKDSENEQKSDDVTNDCNNYNKSPSKISRRICIFNENLQMEFRDIFAKTKLPTNARCILCNAIVSVKYSGRCALTTHVNSKKHKKNRKQTPGYVSTNITKKKIKLDTSDLVKVEIEKNSENVEQIKKEKNNTTLDKSKKRYCKFNRILQEKMKNDYDPVEESEYKAFCKTCKKNISMKKGSIYLIRHLQTRKHLRTLGFGLKEIVKKSYVCEHCGNTYDNRRRYRDHIATHSDIKKFKCKFCEKEFRTSPQLKTHTRTHTGERPYQCIYCGLRFSDLSTRQKHERRHTNERPYSCELCGKSFSRASKKKEHVRIHTGEKPYSCEVCVLHFSRQDNLKQHFNTKIHQSKASAVKNEEVSLAS